MSDIEKEPYAAKGVASETSTINPPNNETSDGNLVTGQVTEIGLGKTENTAKQDLSDSWPWPGT